MVGQDDVSGFDRRLADDLLLRRTQGREHGVLDGEDLELGKEDDVTGERGRDRQRVSLLEPGLGGLDLAGLDPTPESSSACTGTAPSSVRISEVMADTGTRTVTPSSDRDV